MKNDFSSSDFFAIISKWLKNAGPCKNIGQKVENYPQKIDFHEKSEYCKADSYELKKDNEVFTIFKLEQILVYNVKDPKR